MTIKSLHRFALRRLASALGTVVLAAGVANAEAASIVFNPIAQNAAQGAQVSFDLIADFDGLVLLGGAVDIAWNEQLLALVDFNFSAAMAPPRRDTAFDVVDLQSAGLLSVGFGNFGGLTLPAGTNVGTLTFSVLGGPVQSTALMLSDSVKWSGFFDVDGDPLEVNYVGAEFGRLNAVPLPGSQWLLLSAAAGLAGVLRRRSSAA